MGKAYKGYMLALLTAILAFNYVDRLALGLVLQDIKASYHLHDWQLGMLSGIAFAVFYSLMGIPIARWADRGNRRTIISLCTGLWTAAVALSGFAASFPQLLLARVGVAVGEAGCMPPGHSLIADTFDRSERPRAVGVYMLGSTLSVLIGYLLAGWLNARFGWHVMFRLLALPGLLLALLAWLTLREPRTQARVAASDSKPQAPQTTYSVRQVIAALWGNATFRSLWISFSIMGFFSHGIVEWQPTYLVRTFHVATDELGVWLTLIYGVGGTVGTYVGGVLASRYAARNETFQLRATAAVYAFNALLMMGFFLCRDMRVAIAINTVGVVVASLVSGPLFGTIQTVVPERMRAMSITLLYLLGNLIGMGLGPLATGALSDALAPWAGAESLRWALIMLCPIAIVGCWFVLRAARTVAGDIERITSADAAAAEAAAAEAAAT